MDSGEVDATGEIWTFFNFPLWSWITAGIYRSCCEPKLTSYRLAAIYKPLRAYRHRKTGLQRSIPLKCAKYVTYILNSKIVKQYAWCSYHGTFTKVPCNHFSYSALYKTVFLPCIPFNLDCTTHFLSVFICLAAQWFSYAVLVAISTNCVIL